MYRGIFMATIKQIAEITNVSRGTIDRVLNNRGGVSPETEKKVRAAMEALNYLPNKAAQNLAVRRKKLKFGFILISPNNYNPFFADVEKGIRKKALELEEFGVTVDIRFTPINEINKQLELLDDFVANEYNGIVITAYNTAEISRKIQEISSQGIPVVTCNTDIPDSGRIAYVGSNFYQCGQVAANLMGMITGGKAKVGIISGSENIMCITQRNAGFQNYLRDNYPDAQILATVSNNCYDDVESYLITRKILKENPEINALYLSAAGVSAACRAVTECDRKITVISNDCTPATKQLLEAGVIAATIDQEPGYQGSKPLDILFNAITNGPDSIREYYYTNAIIKIRSNLSVRPTEKNEL